MGKAVKSYFRIIFKWTCIEWHTEIAIFVNANTLDPS